MKKTYLQLRTFGKTCKKLQTKVKRHETCEFNYVCRVASSNCELTDRFPRSPALPLTAPIYPVPELAMAREGTEGWPSIGVFHERHAGAVTV